MASLKKYLENKITQEAAYTSTVGTKETTFEKFFSDIYQAFGVRPRYAFKEIPSATSTNKKRLSKLIDDGGMIMIQIKKKYVDTEEEKEKILKDPKKHITVAMSSTRPKITIVKPEVKGMEEEK